MAGLKGTRTFRITVDIQVGLKPPNPELDVKAEEFLAETALMQELLSRPQVLLRLLRAEAICELGVARKSLEAEYGDSRTSQELLSSVISGLEVNLRRYFTEGYETDEVYATSQCTAEPFAAKLVDFGMLEIP